MAVFRSILENSYIRIFWNNIKIFKLIDVSTRWPWVQSRVAKTHQSFALETHILQGGVYHYHTYGYMSIWCSCLVLAPPFFWVKNWNVSNSAWYDWRPAYSADSLTNVPTILFNRILILKQYFGRASAVEGSVSLIGIKNQHWLQILIKG